MQVLANVGLSITEAQASRHRVVGVGGSGNVGIIAPIGIAAVQVPVFAICCDTSANSVCVVALKGVALLKSRVAWL